MDTSPDLGLLRDYLACQGETLPEVSPSDNACDRPECRGAVPWWQSGDLCPRCARRYLSYAVDLPGWEGILQGVRTLEMLVDPEGRPEAGAHPLEGDVLLSSVQGVLQDHARQNPVWEALVEEVATRREAAWAKFHAQSDTLMRTLVGTDEPWDATPVLLHVLMWENPSTIEDHHLLLHAVGNVVSQGDRWLLARVDASFAGHYQRRSPRKVLHRWDVDLTPQQLDILLGFYPLEGILGSVEAHAQFERALEAVHLLEDVPSASGV